MSTTNENILKSLAVLEQNLKDINSAKEQVNSVVKSSGDLAKVIESYKSTFENLSINVKAVLEDSRKFNNDSIQKLSEQTTNFSKEITKLTEFDVSKCLDSIESKTIKQFEQNLNKPLEDLDKQITNIKNEVSKLSEFDFKDTFTNLEKQVVKQFNTDLKEKLDAIDNKAIDLQSKIDEFKSQISRIEKVDLESHFNNIQTILTTHYDKQSVELSKKYDEVISKSDCIILRLDKQDKEVKTLKILLLVTIGIIIAGLATILVVK
jgi:predicted  nucleic acid-binding Zn-ribbon protein